MTAMKVLIAVLIVLPYSLLWLCFYILHGYACESSMMTMRGCGFRLEILFRVTHYCPAKRKKIQLRDL